MKQRKRAILRRLFIWLMALSLLISTSIGTAVADPSAGGSTVPETGQEGTLTPPDYSYESNNIILHKQAERTGPTEWKVNVKVTVGEKPVEKRKLEVVFVLDCSGSMAWCTDQAAHEAGNHSHSWSCRDTSTYVCGKEEHEHSYSACTSTTQCTRNNNPAHWAQYGNYNYYYHIDGTTCVERYGNYYPLDPAKCSKEEHEHSNSCYRYTCGQAVHSGSGATPCTYINENGQLVQYETRLESAKKAINSLVANMTKDGADNVVFKYVIFSSADSDYDNGVNKPSNQSTMVVGSFNNVTAEGGTYMYTGIETGLGQFSENDYKKVMVVLTDGAANDSNRASTVNTKLNTFKNPDGTDGTVFTIGFGYNSDTLGTIAGNGGSYVHASDADTLQFTFANLEQSLTAMLEDPMGTNVGFTSGSIEEIQNTSGVISNNGETIYWHPKSDGTGTVANSIIEYTYKVTLDDETTENADSHTVGTHSGVPLNRPTYFKYGIKDADGVADMKEALFPIPDAEYAYSSIQTKWQLKTNGTDLQTPLDVKKIICDYSDSEYTPAYPPEYTAAPPAIIPIENSPNYYRYVGTVVKINGVVQPEGMSAIDATNPVAHEVIHQYEYIEADKLVVSVTKTLEGRDFLPNERISFRLTALKSNAPMPEGSSAAPNSVKEVQPVLGSGNTVTFDFGTIDFDTEGEYAYTIQEIAGTQDKVIYDTRERTMVVKVENVNGQLKATYTVDGVANAPINIVNRLEPGTLKVEKARVDSHLEEHKTQEFGFLINVKNQSNRPLSGNYTLKKSDGTTATVTFTNGYASVKLKAGEHVIIEGLPDGATYTVTEDAAGGFTPTATGDTGTIVANQQCTASFINTYAASSRYQFVGTKKLDGAEMTLNQFSFRITDENGNVVARGKNTEDGVIFFDTITFTHEDIGEKVYHYVAEDVGEDGNYIYDPTVYTVKLTITDNGDGTLNIVADKKNEDIVFSNKYLADVLRVRKKVTGNMGNRYQPFPFTLTVQDGANQTINLSTDGGLTFSEVTLDGSGKTTFELMHGQNIIFYPVTGTFTVTETANGSYTTSYSLNGADAVSDTSVTAINQDGGSTVEFVNTLDVGVPTGVSLPNSAALAGIAMAMALLAIVYAGRRWKPLEK